MEENKNEIEKTNELNNNINNTPINQQTGSNKNTNILLVVIIIILIILLGIAVYFLFIKKENGENKDQILQPTSTPIINYSPESTITPEPSATSIPTSSPNTESKQNSKYKLASETTFKSKDGKKDIFTIDKIDLEESEGGNSFNATYNGNKFIFYINEWPIEVEQYVSFVGIPDSDYDTQCYPASVILDLKNMIIEKINTVDQRNYELIKTNNGYFFIEGYCLSGYNKIAYDSNWKKLGRLVSIKPDNKGNIYTFNNGKIAKYDAKGNKIQEKNSPAIVTGPGLIYNDILYYLSTENDGTYLINNDTSEKYQLNNDKYNDIDPYMGLDVEDKTLLKLENNKIMILFDSSDEKPQYSFDLNNKKIEKMN